MQNIDKEEDKKVLKNQNEQKLLGSAVPWNSFYLKQINNNCKQK
jgi:hypothetical protein